MMLRTFDSKSDLMDAAYSRLLEEFSSPPVQGRPVGVMLSGGNTPLPIFQRLSDEGADVAENLHILYTDDRLVPYDSGDNNYGNSRMMLDRLNIPPQQILHLNTDLDLDSAATTYDADLKGFLHNNGVISLGVLGLGPDGHTCSIFTEADARRDDCLAFAVPERLGFDRVTVSRLVLAHTQKLIFLAAGENKRDMLRALLNAPQTIPAGIAIDGHPDVEIWTDINL